MESREYIDSLENSGTKLTREGWRKWIVKEVSDIIAQDPEAYVLSAAEIEDVIDTLDADGYVD